MAEKCSNFSQKSKVAIINWFLFFCNPDFPNCQAGFVQTVKSWARSGLDFFELQAWSSSSEWAQAFFNLINISSKACRALLFKRAFIEPTTRAFIWALLSPRKSSLVRPSLGLFNFKLLFEPGPLSQSMCQLHESRHQPFWAYVSCNLSIILGLRCWF